MSMKRFASKVVVVSGGADGCGRAASIRFAEEGAKVAIIDIHEEQGKKTAQEIRVNGG